MDKEKQQNAPFVTALEEYCKKFFAYHTPGHKLGQGISAYQKNSSVRHWRGIWGSCMRLMIYSIPPAL